MIFNMVGGGSGSVAFQFEVVNGTTQPTAPAENTIWINTGVGITAWAFQAEQPTGAEGLLWIQTAAASVVAFDAVEEDNAIMIYPTGTKLYTGGAWTAVEAFIYQAGAWVQFATLFGIDSLSITGTEGEDYVKIDDGDGNWRIKILTSQTVTVADPGEIDVFCVGGGGGGAGQAGGGGGGGGYTTTALGVVLEPGAYNITIGAGGAGTSSSNQVANTGGETTAFGVSAEGGKGGSSTSCSPSRVGGAGGSGGGGGGGSDSNGGNGGEDGGNGTSASGSGGTGQGTTTREFGEDAGDLYAGGGGGKGAANGAGGSAANTGGGGKGQGGSGYSGIVIIRNKRG